LRVIDELGSICAAIFQVLFGAGSFHAQRRCADILDVGKIARPSGGKLRPTQFDSEG